MNKRPISINLLLILNLIIIFSGYVLGDNFCGSGDKIIEKPMKAELVQKIGSDKKNEDFFNPESFAIDDIGRIYILDTGNSRIQCFSNEGTFLLSFGKRGQGPGELSNQASKIKILEDKNIYIIDNYQRRINIYDLEGQFQYSKKIPRYYDDIVLVNETYYLSGILLKDNFKPIDFSRTLEKIDGSFGIFIEPAVDIVKEVNKLPTPEPWRNIYMGCNWTNLIVSKKNEIIYSQENPYHLVKYDLKGQVLEETHGDANFNTYAHIKFIVHKDSISVSGTNQAKISHLSIKGDNQLIVPFFNPDKDLFFMDYYDFDLNLISRYKMQNSIVDYKKNDFFKTIIVDDDNYLYGLVISQHNPAHLVKYKLFFD
ncbi:MAG: 6-bladed beta-propeller [Bacteroidales bacterium]|nr:6-bladed beta-propeller [Bacteroidales bacterium]